MGKHVDIKYKDLIDPSVKESLNYFLDSIEFPVLFSHKIAKVSSFIFSEIDMIELMRNKLVKKYGVEDSSTNTVSIVKGTVEEEKYVKEFMLFLEEKIVTSNEKISLSLISEYKIKPIHLKNLKFLFID